MVGPVILVSRCRRIGPLTNLSSIQLVGLPLIKGPLLEKIQASKPLPPLDEALKTIRKSLGDNESKLTFNHELTLVDEPYLKATIEAEFKNTESNSIFTIKNGKVDSASISEYLIEQQGFPKVCAKLMVDQLGQMKLSEKVSFGNLSIEVGTGSENLYKVSFIYNASEVEGKVVTGGFSFTFAVEVDPITFIKEKMGDIYAKIASKLSQFIKPIALIIAVGLLVGLAVSSSVEIAMATAIAFIITVIKHLIPITK